uniref:Uncharacterized protein n=1 Tax=Panagrolaimus sp. PS1159 TaxID=55785 RepID=A0AC35GSD9_9BILA
MSANDEFMVFKYKQQYLTNSQTNQENQYSNLNLHQSCKVPILIPLQAYSEVSDNCKKETYSLSLHKSSKWLELKKNAEKESKNHWKKYGNTTKKSTLSIHIATYEKSVEAAESDPKKENLKNSISKTMKNEKQILTSPFIVQNPFEFLRQQSNDKVPQPEVSQFRASNSLLNPNEALNNGQHGIHFVQQQQQQNYQPLQYSAILQQQYHPHQQQMLNPRNQIYYLQQNTSHPMMPQNGVPLQRRPFPPGFVPFQHLNGQILNPAINVPQTSETIRPQGVNPLAPPASTRPQNVNVSAQSTINRRPSSQQLQRRPSTKGDEKPKDPSIAATAEYLK